MADRSFVVLKFYVHWAQQVSSWVEKWKSRNVFNFRIGHSIMAVSVKLRDEDKERLDRLRAKLLLAGVNLNQEELLSRLIDLGESFLPGLDHLQMKELSEEERKQILSRKYKLGGGSWKTIDDELYGGK